jgi:hypothetical protein
MDARELGSKIPFPEQQQRHLRSIFQLSPLWAMARHHTPAVCTSWDGSQSAEKGIRDRIPTSEPADYQTSVGRRRKHFS